MFIILTEKGKTMGLISTEEARQILIEEKIRLENDLRTTQASFKNNIQKGVTIKSNNLADCCAFFSKNGIDQTRINGLEKCLQKCQEAEIRLQKGVWGLCITCEEQIPIERLKIIPFATQCILCKTKEDKKEKVYFI